MQHVRLCLVGLGNVGRAFLRLLEQKREKLEKEYDFTYSVTGIATARHGMAIDPDGLDPYQTLHCVENHGTLETLSKTPMPFSVFDLIRTCSADSMLENTPVNHQTGQPALDHLRAGLECGMHAITANKGPVVHGHEELMTLAKRKGKRFLFESAVMDGAPIFSLFRDALPAVELRAFTGILNSCTNFMLGLMEDGFTLEETIRRGQAIGITETDPSADIDGWDAAIKVAALSTVLMGVPLKPQDVQREGIRGITPNKVLEAREAGERWKLLCHCQREGVGVQASVQPVRVKAGSAFYSVNGTSSFVQFEMDTLPGLGILESDPGPETTAYGLLADLINAVRGG